MEHDKCTFKQEYYDNNTGKDETFECDIEHMENKKFCLFHDEIYLKYHKNKDNVIKKLYARIDYSISYNAPLLCIGYHLPDIEIKREFKQPVYFNHSKFQDVNFSEATFSEIVDFSDATFSGPAYFNKATFSAVANFHGATFSGPAYFPHATFSAEAYFDATFSGLANFDNTTFSVGVGFFFSIFSGPAYFNKATFSGPAYFDATFSEIVDFSDATFSAVADFTNSTFSDKTHFSGGFKDTTYFNYITFEKPNKIIFEVEDMSKVSFINTDITGIRFSDKTSWGGKENFQVIEEKWLEEDGEKPFEERRVSLGGVLSVYRNLRENYEFRRRYDEAGKFFIREMELKRKYREVKSTTSPSSSDYKIKKNHIIRRNISLTGIYYHLSRYGEDLLRPTLAGIVIVILATFFFVCQNNLDLAPSFSFNHKAVNTNNNKPISRTINNNSTTTTTSSPSNFINITQIGNGTHWLKAGERSLADFLPLLSLGGDIKVGLIDYLIKIVGGAVTFGLIAIALRRRFERKYTH